MCYTVTVAVNFALEQAIRAQRWVHYSSNLSLTSVLDGDGRLKPRPCRFPPGKGHSIRCIGGWVGPKAILHECGISNPHRDSIPGPTSR
jgi:hypothetical protein